MVDRTQANFPRLREALVAGEDVESLLSPAHVIQSWSRGQFDCHDGVIKYNGDSLPDALTQRILRSAEAKEPIEPFLNFWERLQKNPSHRSVEQLWGFLQHCGIPLTDDGCFLAYKGVREDYYDRHSGTLLNTPGSILQMPRNRISDDPDWACHVGLHVGALQYAQGFGPRVVICKVDPADVVCVPKDHSQQKMRTCRYEVVGEYAGVLLEDTTTQADRLVARPFGEQSDFEDEDEEDDFDDIDDDCYDGMHDDSNYKEDVADSVADVVCFTVASKTQDTTKQTPATLSPQTEELTPERIDAMNKESLELLSMDVLRRYASSHLKIVGAYRIPGGKSALVGQIIRVRRLK